MRFFKLADSEKSDRLEQKKDTSKADDFTRLRICNHPVNHSTFLQIILRNTC